MTTIGPCLWFDGKAEEAARFYVSLLPDSRIDNLLRLPVDWPGGKAGDVVTVEFTLAGKSHIALNGGPHFKFTPAISLFVTCDTQAEVDRLWDALLAGGQAMQCGWLTDRYGVAWQIVPKGFLELMMHPDKAKAKRLTEAMMGMVKLDLPALQRVAEGA
ncbi:MAG: VOC family protein [Variibacter sp.]|nr:VOC family protein [Variibacter sp.]